MKTIVVKKTFKFFKTLAAIAIAAACNCSASASVVSEAIAGGAKLIEHGAEKVGLKTAAKVAVKGGAEFAAAKAARTAVGAAERIIQPGVVLATGGATAAIVAAHELADGVQTKDEAAADAIRKNPELAKEYINGDDRAKAIALPLVIVVVALVVLWMFFPLLTLGRTWIKARAQIAAAKQTASTDAAPAKPASAMRSGFTRFELLLMTVGFIVLTTLGIRSCINDKPDGPGLPPIQPHQIDPEIKAAFSHAESDYRNAVGRAYKKFESGLDEAVNRAYRPAMNAIPSVVDRYGAFGKISHVVKTMVVDKLSNSNSLNQEIQNDLQSGFYPAIYRAHDAVLDHCRTLLRDLEVARGKYIGQVNEIRCKLPEDLESEFNNRLEASAQHIDRVQSKLSSAQIDAAIAAVVEAVCIRATLRTLWQVLGKTVARHVAALVAGGIVAVADGPIPIGDAIGIVLNLGCTAWSICDIWRATYSIPRELEKALRDCVSDCRQSSADAARKAAEAIVAAYLGNS